MRKDGRGSFPGRKLQQTKIMEGQVARLMLRGYNCREIARKLHYTFHGVYKLIERDSFKQELKKLSDDVFNSADRELELMYRTVVKRLRTLVKKGNSDVALAAIQEFNRMTGRIRPKIIERLEKGFEQTVDGNDQKQLEAGSNVVPMTLPPEAAKHARAFLKMTRQIESGGDAR